MIIYNLKKESNVSKALLTQTAEGEGKSLSEIICKYGLPIDPAFETLINVLKCEKIEAGFKKYVIEKAQEMSKTDKDREALACYVDQESIDKVESKLEIKKIEFITKDVREEINYQLNRLTLEITKKERKEAFKKLDKIFLSLIPRAKGNKENLQEIRNFLPEGHKRIPYLNQELGRKR